MLAVTLVGVASVIVASLATTRDVVQDLGVPPAKYVVALEQGQEACQSPVGLAHRIRRVGFFPGPLDQVRGPIAIALRAGNPSGRDLATATFPRGRLSPDKAVVELDRAVDGNRDVALCLRNLGAEPLEPRGDFDTSRGLQVPKRYAASVLVNPSRTTDALHVNGVEVAGDLAASFPRSESISLLGLAPAVAEHASRFKPAGVGPWTFWLLLALIVGAVPLVLARALAAAEPDGDD